MFYKPFGDNKQNMYAYYFRAVKVAHFALGHHFLWFISDSDSDAT